MFLFVCVHAQTMSVFDLLKHALSPEGSGPFEAA